MNHRVILNTNKGLDRLIIGLEENIELFQRSVVCISKDGIIYKIISVEATKSDGSINIFFPYSKDKDVGIISVHYDYKSTGAISIPPRDIIQELKLDKDCKLSLHRSGFVQFSGNGVRSGIDPSTGLARGIGHYSAPLDRPVASGPTFGLLCWGLEQNFDILDKRKSNVQYIILQEEDFSSENITKNQDWNSYNLSFILHPASLKSRIYKHKARAYLDTILNSYIYSKPDEIFPLIVVDLKYLPEVLTILPTKFHHSYKDQAYGFVVGSPGGYRRSMPDPGERSRSFHLICLESKTPYLHHEAKLNHGNNA